MRVGYYGQIVELSYTEEVGGSSPSSPTWNRHICRFLFSCGVDMGVSDVEVDYVRNICCNVLQPAATRFTIPAQLSRQDELVRA